MALVPLSVSMSRKMSRERRRNVLYPASSIAVTRSRARASRSFCTMRTLWHEHAAAAHGLALVVERERHLVGDDVGHRAVDLAREVDEARLVVQRPHLPREIVRV